VVICHFLDLNCDDIGDEKRSKNINKNLKGHKVDGVLMLPFSNAQLIEWIENKLNEYKKKKLKISAESLKLSQKNFSKDDDDENINCQWGHESFSYVSNKDYKEEKLSERSGGFTSIEPLEEGFEEEKQAGLKSCSDSSHDESISHFELANPQPFTLKTKGNEVLVIEDQILQSNMILNFLKAIDVVTHQALTLEKVFI
jgi:hypothetical protein